MSGECCGACIHFRNDPAYLETLFAGLAALSSADASVRGDDGHCRRHDRYLSAGAGCANFSPAVAAGLTRRDRSPGTR
jgi:hypothetical protein